MHSSTAPSFLDQFLARHTTPHLSRKLPVWALPLLVLLPPAGTLLYSQQGSFLLLLPSWALILALILTRRLPWQALAICVPLSLLALQFEQLRSASPLLLAAELLLTGVLAICAVYLFERLGQLRNHLEEQARHAQLLRQLCHVWEQTPGNRLLEIDRNGQPLASSKPGTDTERWLDSWQQDSLPGARQAFDEAIQGRLGRFSGRDKAGTWWSVVLIPVIEGDAPGPLLALYSDISKARRQALELHGLSAELDCLLDHLNDGFYRLDHNWCFVQSNAKAAQLLQRQPAELHGKSLWDLYPNTLESELGNALMDVMHSGIPRNLEVFYSPLNTWYRVHAYPRPQGIDVLFNSIEAEVAARRKNRTTEARLRLTQAIGGFADWQLELDSQQLTLSAQALQLLGLPTDLGAAHQDVLISHLHPEDRLTFIAALLDLTEDCRTLNLQLRLRDAANPGGWRDFNFAGLIDHPESRQHGLLLGCVQDVTAQQRREQRLIEAESFTRSIIDALPQYIGVLDEFGRLIAVNQAWSRLTEEHPAAPLWPDVGSDYLALCRTAGEHGLAAAAQLWQYLTALLAGEEQPFALDCQAPLGGELRHFNIRALPMETEQRRLLVVHEDVTATADLHETLNNQAQRLRLAHEGANDGLWEWVPPRGELYLSERFVELTGNSAHSYRDFTHWLREHAHPDEAPVLAAALDGHLHGNEPFDIELRLAGPGGWRWFRARGKAEWDQATLVRFAGSLMDIGLQRDLLAQIQASESRFREMVEFLPHVFWTYDVTRAAVSYVSPALERLWGLPAERVYEDERAWLKLVHPEDRALVERFRQRVLGDLRQGEVEYRSLNGDGDILWIRNRAFPFHDCEGQVVRIVGIAENITEARTYKERLFAVAHFDSSCGLPNQAIFRKRLEVQCAQALKLQQCFSVLFIAVDRLKWVQQCLGQSARDQLIQQVAQRFRRVLDGSGYLASLGNGEFAILFGRGEEQLQGEILIQALLKSLNLHFELGGEWLTLSACMGLARFPEHGENAEQLIRNANAAVYAAQQSGRNGFQVYRADLQQHNQDALKLEAELKRALEQREFVLHYQPKLCLQDQRLCGAEALVRWQHPKHGLIGPLRFIHLLEETGLIVPLGLWCIDQALGQLAAWQQHGVDGFTMAVNLSLRQLQPGLPEQIRQALERHDLSPRCLELELTESIMHETDAAAIVNEIKRLGVRIAVDDFGTGYSTLGSLKSFVPDTLKIDKGFLRDMVSDAADQAIVRGVIEMAHALHMTVVAEGVETSAQKQLLERLQCDQIQGYLLSPPLDASAFEHKFVTQDVRLAAPALH